LRLNLWGREGPSQQDGEWKARKKHKKVEKGRDEGEKGRYRFAVGDRDSKHSTTKESKEGSYIPGGRGQG